MYYILYFNCCYVFKIVYYSLHVDARTMERFLLNVYDNFKMCAHAKKVASELRRRRVIPEAVESKIERALDKKTANGHLYDHLFSQGTFKTLQIVCDVFIHEEGYPRMNELGKSMKDRLAHMHAASSGELLHHRRSKLCYAV